jgi:hypothetical protein
MNSKQFVKLLAGIFLAFRTMLRIHIGKLIGVALSALTIVSCAVVGGGIAGAGFDSVWTRNAARDYAGHRHASLNIDRTGSAPDARQAFDQMFDDFPEHALITQDSSGTLGDLKISFRKQRLSVDRAGTHLIDERLPSVFYMHNLQVARFRAGGRDLLLFLTRSRATTGLSFVGLYNSTGERLWTATIPSNEAWDCAPTADGLTFLGHSQSLHLSFH